MSRAQSTRRSERKKSPISRVNGQMKRKKIARKRVKSGSKKFKKGRTTFTSWSTLVLSMVTSPMSLRKITCCALSPRDEGNTIVSLVKRTSDLLSEYAEGLA